MSMERMFTKKQLIILMYLKNKKNTVYIDKLFHFEFKLPIVKGILRLGIPGAITGFVNTGASFLTSNVLSTLPTVEISAKTAAGGTDPLIGIVNSSMGHAIVATVSRCIGAGDKEQAKYYAKYFVKLSYIVGGLIQGVLFIFAPYVLRIFNLSPETMEIAIVYFRISLIINILFRPVSLLRGDVFRSAGDVKYIMKNSMISLWVFDVLGVYIFRYVFKMNVFGFALANFVSRIYVAISCFYRFKKGTWLNNKVI